MELIQGRAKVLVRDVETHGHVSGSGGRVHGQISSFRTATLDIGGQTVTVKHKEPIVVVDGDEVVVAGERRSGGLQALALANRSRSTRNDAPATLMIALSIVLFLLSIPLLIIVIGILPLALGGFVLYMGLKMRKANAMISEALSRAAPVTVV